MFIPDDNGKTFSIRIPKYILHSILIFLIIFFVGILLLIIKSGEIAAKLQVLTLIRMENEQLNREIDELRLIKSKIGDLYQISNYLFKISSLNNNDDGLNSNSKFKMFVDSINDTNDQTYQHFIKSEKQISIPNITPVEGWITRQFNQDTISDNRNHLGIDFAPASGTPIKATANGVVGKIENDKFYGILITVLHENGYSTRYGHCSQALVAKHERVNKGQTIALVGNTGRSTAPHLHYEILKDGKNINPIKNILVHGE